jgi:hypothetical protein
MKRQTPVKSNLNVKTMLTAVMDSTAMAARHVLQEIVSRGPIPALMMGSTAMVQKAVMKVLTIV